MAANEYYESSNTPNPYDTHRPNLLGPPSPPSASPKPPSPPPASTKPPTSLYTNYQSSGRSDLNSPYSATGPIDSPYDTPYHSRDSYHDGVVGGTLQDDRQYADTIPLKSPHPRPYSEDQLVGQHIQYPPSPGSQHLPNSDRRKKRRQGWFSGKITWVVFVVTLVQVGVFIGEIVSNGEPNTSFCNFSLTGVRKQPRQVHLS